jgi:hypothetical protein
MTKYEKFMLNVGYYAALAFIGSFVLGLIRMATK